MTNQPKIVRTSITVIVAACLLALNPSILANAQAQMYDNQYGNDNYYENDNIYGYDYNPEKIPEVKVQKINCINTNISINGDNTGSLNIGNGQVRTAEDETRGDVSASSVGANGERYNNGYEGYNQKHKDFTCIIENNNTNNNIIAADDGGNATEPTGTLNVSKTISCEPGGTGDLPPLICTLITTGNPTPSFQISPDEFNIAVSGNNPSPPQFDGSTTPVDVTLGTGNYQVTETAKASVNQTIDAMEMTHGVTINGPTATFSGDCTPPFQGSLSASGAIAGGELQTCNVDNEFTVFGPEICLDAVDNDGDGLIDCADPDCANACT